MVDKQCSSQLPFIWPVLRCVQVYCILHFLLFRQLLLCRVALGKSFLQFSAMKMAHSPPGHHSVIGRPSAGGLHFPEYVVYRGEQVGQRHSVPCTSLRSFCPIFIHRLCFIRRRAGISRVLGNVFDRQARGQLQRQRGLHKMMGCKHPKRNRTIGDAHKIRASQ